MNNRIQKEVVRINSIDYLFIYLPANADIEMIKSYREVFKDSSLSGKVFIIASLHDE